MLSALSFVRTSGVFPDFSTLDWRRPVLRFSGVFRTRLLFNLMEPAFPPDCRWRDAQPKLLFEVVRQLSHGARRVHRLHKGIVLRLPSYLGFLRARFGWVQGGPGSFAGRDASGSPPQGMHRIRLPDPLTPSGQYAKVRVSKELPSQALKRQTLYSPAPLERQTRWDHRAVPI